MPTAVGKYELKLSVAQTENYLAGEAMTEFSIKPTELSEDDKEDSAEGNGNSGASGTSNSSGISNSSDVPNAGHLAKEMEQDGLIQVFAGTCLFMGSVAVAVLLCKKQNR